jgi:surfactin synthase thioesterase subunit
VSAVLGGVLADERLMSKCMQSACSRLRRRGGPRPPGAQVSAVLGGVLANEVLKAVSRRGEPISNFFFFSLADGAGVVERMA